MQVARSESPVRCGGLILVKFDTFYHWFPTMFYPKVITGLVRLCLLIAFLTRGPTDKDYRPKARIKQGKSGLAEPSKTAPTKLCTNRRGFDTKIPKMLSTAQQPIVLPSTRNLPATSIARSSVLCTWSSNFLVFMIQLTKP